MTSDTTPPDPTALLTPDQVCAHLGIPKATLYQWRYRGTAPRAIKVGKHTRYRRADVDAWVEAHADDRRQGELG
jgi:excisionase family DNA binding protein